MSNVNIPVSTNTQELGLLEVFLGGNSYQAGIYHTTGVPGNEGFYIDNDGTVTDSGTTDTEGQITISRTGSSISINAGTLNAVNTDSGAVTSIKLYNLVFQTSSSGYTADVHFSNFTVKDGVSGSLVYQKRALFYEGTDLKYAYNDSGEDLTQIDIELDSIGAQAYTQEYDNFRIQSPKGTNYCT